MGKRGTCWESPKRGSASFRLDIQSINCSSHPLSLASTLAHSCGSNILKVVGPVGAGNLLFGQKVHLPVASRQFANRLNACRTPHNVPDPRPCDTPFQQLPFMGGIIKRTVSQRRFGYTFNLDLPSICVAALPNSSKKTTLHIAMLDPSSGTITIFPFAR
ncbi:hypothetical protein B0H12DRAFT_208028 [Mycena haematopus]|nr:hypothetical protein B0H12DRAFT_208028 [Mycena haematopus]